MKVLLVKSNLIGSKLISWGLDSEGSHIALSFLDKLVVHSTSSGVNLQWQKTFKEHYVIVKEKECPLVRGKEFNLLNSVLDEDDNKKYDWLALIYFLWRGLLRKFFKIPLPRKNKFDQAKGRLCTEMIKWVPEDYFKLGQKPGSEQISIMRPDDVIELLV